MTRYSHVFALLYTVESSNLAGATIAEHREGLALRLEQIKDDNEARAAFLDSAPTDTVPIIQHKGGQS